MTAKTPDYGHRYAEKQLAALIKRLNISYRRASLSLLEKAEKYLERFEKEDAEKRALYDSGELSHDEYTAWRYKKIAGTKQWTQLQERLVNDMTQQNRIAAAMINDALPDIYALNHNYGTYEAETGSGIDTTYTLYDKHTAARLLRDKRDLLPAPAVDIPKDQRWNKQHLQSAVLQGILTGESMDDIAGRFQAVTDMSARAAVRNARTAVTGAENAGRIDSYKRAESLGIKIKQVWMATLDSRTRDSHALMDGEQVNVGEKFSNGCRYPGDPHGRPEEVYNCRCTLIAEVEGSNAYDPSDVSVRKSQYLEDAGLTYEQWKEIHSERYYKEQISEKNSIINSGFEAEFSRLKPGSDERAIVSDIIETKPYAQKFHNLGESEKVENIMTFQARTTLWRRNGTPFEDLIYVNPKTGEWLAQRLQDIEGGGITYRRDDKNGS